MGTMLQARGLVPGVSPEEFSLKRPDILKSIHREYIEAGADVITTNTFGASRLKLSPEFEVFSFNRKMAEIARQAAKEAKEMGRPVFVAGSVGPSGHFIRPLGEMSFREMVEVYREQIRGLLAGGVDLILAETHFDLAELRAVAVAVREESNLPFGASMTFEEGVSLTGTTPSVFKETMLNMGAAIIATNCSAGPLQMQKVVQELLNGCSAPVLVEPNAGLPELENGQTVFRLGPEEFATHTLKFAQMGARLLGGCCGTTPAHIKALRQKLNSLPPPSPLPKPRNAIALTSRSSLVYIGPDEPLKIIGERINPTGKKQLTAELQAGDFTLALRYGEEQVQRGAPVLDVNVGAPMVNEAVLLPQLVEALAARLPAPLCLDSSNPSALEAALEVYPGSALLNSINDEPGRVAELAPLCRKYGAPFILLPLSGGDLPDTAAKRIAILEKILLELEQYNIPNNLILVDVLALAVSSNPMAASACLETIEHCKSMGLCSSVGLSNISFGLPAREILNAHFLSMAAGAGLCACIANPANLAITNALAAANALLGKNNSIDEFVSAYAEWKPDQQALPGLTLAAPDFTTTGKAENKNQSKAPTLTEAVIEGRKEIIVRLVEDALAAGQEPFKIVQETLIPAITTVGEKYERKEFFLPQLLKSAETMQSAFARLKPLLEEENSAALRPVIVMATVEGDIHDIGKNIVILMLSNHGFEVIDLGKDVRAEEIVKAAEKHNASLIGLSALMTTTMVRMEDTVKLVRQKNLRMRVMIGGAVVTDDFAQAIGADGYASDAVSSVRLAQTLLKEL